MDTTERAPARDRTANNRTPNARTSGRLISVLDEWRFAPRTALVLSGGGAKGAFAVTQFHA